MGNTNDVAEMGTILPETAGSDSGELGISLLVQCRSPHDTNSRTHLIAAGGVIQGSSGAYYSGYYATYGATRMATTNVNALKFYFNTGNIESGEIRMYGIKDS